MPNQNDGKNPEQRFWEKVRRSPGCWEWMASLNRLGYGTLGRNGKLLKAHRVSWEIHNGPIPPGLCVLHRCDNRRCVRPDHLFLGTQRENIADMCIKGRHQSVGLWGSRNPMARTSEAEILEIRRRAAAGESQRSIALAFGASPMRISRIVNRKSWRHV